MSAASAAGILSALADHGVRACVGGGWSVDALLGEQTREHSDLDLWVDATEAENLFAAMNSVGVDRIFPWPGDRPWNFVLHDGSARRVDLHFYEAATGDLVHYGPYTGDETIPRSAFAGAGAIGSLRVRCERPEWAVRWHTGYPPRPTDRADVARLCARYGLDLPPAYL